MLTQKPQAVVVLRLLIDQGADLHLKQESGDDVLSLALHWKQPDIVQMVQEALEAERIRTAQPSESWVAMDSHSVAHVESYPSIGQKLTTIFNFESRHSLVIVDDLITKAKAVTPPVSFDEIHPAVLEKALQEFTQREGKADPVFVLRGVTRLDKPQPKL